MTTSLAYIVKAWFTSTMPTTTRTRETISEKAERIATDPARTEAVLDNAPHVWAGKVHGDHGTYGAFAFSEDFKRMREIDLDGRVGCTCRAGRVGRLCSHALVAERMRTR